MDNKGSSNKYNGNTSMNREEIIPAVDRSLLLSELNESTFLRITNYSDNEIHLVDHRNAPNVLREIGRLREMSFRAGGGGSGKSIDLDDFDVRDNPYQQMIVWSPEHQEILGGYRLFDCSKADFMKDGKPDITMSRLFNYSDEYLEKYLPHSIELGRSFVQPEFQFRNQKAAVFVLDNLWDGIGAVVKNNPHIKYLFGKVSIYPHIHPDAQKLMLSFLNIHFNSGRDLITAIDPVEVPRTSGLFTGEDLKTDYKLLRSELKEYDAQLPPLINAYMNLDPAFEIFSTTINTYFGNLIDSAIQITVEMIPEHKRKRYFGE
jgi:hypothetical protein